MILNYVFDRRSIFTCSVVFDNFKRDNCIESIISTVLMSDFNCFVCDSRVLELPVIAFSYKSNRESLAQFENRTNPGVYVRKKGGKNQESIHSSTTPEPKYHIGDK